MNQEGLAWGWLQQGVSLGRPPVWPAVAAPLWGCHCRHRRCCCLHLPPSETLLSNACMPMVLLSAHPPVLAPQMLVWLGDFNYRIDGAYEAVKERAIRNELGQLLELVGWF